MEMRTDKKVLGTQRNWVPVPMDIFFSKEEERFGDDNGGDENVCV